MKVAVVQLSSAAPRVRALDRALAAKDAAVKDGAVKAVTFPASAAGRSPAARSAELLHAGAPARPGLGGPLVLLCAAVLCGSVLACRSGDVNEPAPTSASNAAAGGAAAGPNRARPTKASNDGLRPKAAEPWHIPVGPKLAIAPGKGFGAIRFGARLDTIERLIGEPCEEKTEQGGKVTCRYSAQAVDFVLENGVVTEMRAHRLGRPFKNSGKPDYGIFNGGFENGLAFGMVPAAARELVGAPKSVRPITGDNPFHTVEVHEYDGFRLEFDRVGAESVVLGGVVLDAPKT